MSEDLCELLCLDLPRAERIRQSLDPGLARRAAVHARALADPTRMGIALALSEAHELCVCDVAWIVSRAENLAGHHLRALREAGLARSRRDGKIVFYRLTAPGHELVNAHRLAVQVPV